ncbi:MAG TPA: tripartite tricarboxylate transporter substrate binding protein [Burkholderiales bacterium]|nr:tripartite tricarboxylate transporter substrate binding protein [Burkholderiales bacterium]
MKIRVLASAALIALLPAVSAAAQYPDRPVRFVVPFPPGGTNDIFARVVGAKLGEYFGEQVVIDNRPGGGGSLGAEIAAKARPDGYTLLLANTGPNAIDVSLRPRSSYDPVRDFAPVTQIASVPLVLAVHGGLAAKTLSQFVAAAKAAPGQLNYASAGNGSIAHLATELFKAHAGVSLSHVPYKGTPQALTDLVSGTVSLLFTTTVSSGPFIKTGKIRPLAIAAPERSPLLPDVPTMAQAGQKGFELSSWYGIVVPAKTPQAIVDRLYRETAKALRSPDIVQRFEALGGNAVGSDPQAFGIFLRQEVERWANAVRLSGARID